MKSRFISYNYRLIRGVQFELKRLGIGEAGHIYNVSCHDAYIIDINVNPGKERQFEEIMKKYKAIAV